MSRSHVSMTPPPPTSHSFITPPSRSFNHSSQNFNSYFHIFRTLTWQEYPWKTRIFTPPQAHCAFDEDHCHRLLVSQAGFDTVEEPRRNILQALAKTIDTFALHVSHHHSLQSKLNKSFERDFGSDGHVILRALVKCIILDRFCWVLNLGVFDTYSQHRNRPNNDNNNSPVRNYRKVITTTRTIRTAIRVKQSLPQGSMAAEEDGDKYLGLAFAAWHTGQSDASAVVANMCFASVSCLCFIHDLQMDRQLWERFTQRFKFDSLDYYNKLDGMIKHRDLASWKLWYRAIAVSPVLMLDPRFIRSDRSISAKELLVSVNERVGVMPLLILQTEKIIFQCIFELVTLWIDNASGIISQAVEHKVDSIFTLLFQSIIDVEDGGGKVDVEVLHCHWLQDTGSPSKPVHETAAIPGGVGCGRSSGKQKDDVVEEHGDGGAEDRVRKKNIPQLQVLVERDPREATHSSSSVVEGDVANMDIPHSSSDIADADVQHSSSVVNEADIVDIHHQSLSPVSNRPRSKRPRIDSDEEEPDEDGERELSSTSLSEYQDLVDFMQKYDKGDFEEHAPSFTLSDMPSYDDCGRHMIKLWSYRAKEQSQNAWHETTWWLQWTLGMFNYRELHTTLSTLSICGDKQPSALDSELYVNSMAAFEALSVVEQRQHFTQSNIHFTATIIHEDLSIPDVLRTLGVSWVQPMAVQDNRANRQCPGSFIQWLSRPVNVRLDSRVEVAVHHSSPARLWKIDVSTQIGLDNQAKVTYSMPPDRIVNSTGYMLPTWVRVLAGAQLWMVDSGEDKPTSCVLRVGDMLLLRANTPFTTITLKETVVLHGRFVTLFDFYQILHSQRSQNGRNDLDSVLLRLASFIHQTTSLNVEAQIKQLYYVASEDLECLIVWLISRVRGRGACILASRLMKGRLGMRDRVHKLIRN